MAIHKRSARARAAGNNRYPRLQAHLLVSLAVALALPAVATLWLGDLAAALLIPAAPAMIAHLLVGLAVVGVKRRHVAQAIARAHASPALLRWRWTPTQWGAFALSMRRHLATACAAVGAAHGAATLALTLISWDRRLHALPWGAALSLAALSGLIACGLYAEFLLGRYAPIDIGEDSEGGEDAEGVEVWLSPDAICFNGDAIRLRGGGYSLRAVEERPGPPAWLVLHIERPSGHPFTLPLPVPNNDLAVLRDAAARLSDLPSSAPPAP
jgi:hypothetical protein